MVGITTTVVTSALKLIRLISNFDSCFCVLEFFEQYSTGTAVLSKRTSELNGHILKANLSLTRKKVELEWHKKRFVCVCIFLLCTKSRTSGTQVWIFSG